MMTDDNILRKGVKVLYKELGAVQTIEFFRLLGINKGDSLKEIESITKNMSKEEILSLIKKSNKNEKEKSE